MTKPTDKLAELEAVDPREHWPNEAQHFTPWVSSERGLKLLSDTLGIELELHSTEKEVGPYRADIVCKDTGAGDDSWVLIENQLEKTDHAHLGQLLTYAAGLHAVTLVWIVQRITNQHRAALDWLNDIAANTPHNFFGLEIELYRIDDSRRAPRFNVVSKPNDWLKTPPPDGLTEGRQLQLEYWNAFRERVAEKGARFKTRKAQPQHWMYIAVGKGGFRLAAFASRRNSVKSTSGVGELRVELRSRHKSAFAKLEAQQERIKAAIGEELIWENLETHRDWRIYMRKTADVTNRDAWPDQHEWLRERLDTMHQVFSTILQEV